VRIFTATSAKTLVIPRSALFRGPTGKWQVYAVRRGKATLQEVEVGLLNDKQAEISKGLAEGEKVVLAPESSLTSETRVRSISE
jgi:HlyD family secretion protein